LSKHTILFLAANPLGTERLALDRQARAIEVELARSGFRDSFELVTWWATEPLDLLRELRKLKPTVVHFSGQGSRGGDVDGGPDHGLVFQSADGQPRRVSTAALQDAFDAAGSSVKLVVLSACYSDSQAAALLGCVDCVVGMRGSIGDDAACSFAIGFYGALGDRESVAAAYRHGCAAIGLEGLPDGDKPRLRVRDGVDANLVVLADLASGDPAPRPRGSIPPPTPAYLNAEVQALSEQLERARQRKQSLRDAGLGTDEADREILELRRKLRDGGQLRAGDALGDGRYLLVKPVGRGGFAVVWQAWDLTEQRLVAIKVLHHHLASDPQRRERFFRGARVMMDLKHPGVVRVSAPRGEDEAFCYFVMEFVPGGNVREAVLAKKLRIDDVLHIILRVGEALALAHANGMVHRDIKPANILLDEHGNAKLTDFDLVGAQDTTGGTRTSALGTVVYAAPECLEKPQEATARADVYGLGMTLIFGLLGQELSLETFRNPEPTIARLDCAVQVRNVIRRAVAWEPEMRFADASAMMIELRNVSNLAGRLEQETEKPIKVVAQRRLWWRYVAPGVVLVLGAMVLSLVVRARTSTLALEPRVKTNFCEQFGVNCKPGQECAANQAVCIDIGGCGDGIIDKAKGEVCDDGNIVDGETDDAGVFTPDQCSHDCKSTQLCGNNIVDKGEECDLGSGNGLPTSTCDYRCHKVSRVCGNGIVDADAGEECDPGPMDSAGCNGGRAGSVSCKAPRCGDGYTNMAANEKCDSSGVDTMMCNGKLCTLPACGDNYVNMAAGEQCESGGRDAQTCNGSAAGSFACHSPACGDGYINTAFTPSGGQAPEECDNAGGSDTATCNGNNHGNNGPGSCRKPACGDGYTNTAVGEQCDTLGGADTATCNGSSAGSASCKFSVCGDGHVNRHDGEVCENDADCSPLTCSGCRCK
jgi:hypothetical protein